MKKVALYITIAVIFFLIGFFNKTQVFVSIITTDQFDTLEVPATTDEPALTTLAVSDEPALTSPEVPKDADSTEQ